MTVRQRLDALREKMAKDGFAGCLIFSEDDHQSEYVDAYYRVREFFSGFTGSAGILAVTRKEAALWTDGRYFLQADEQLRGSGIDLMRMGEKNTPSPTEFLQHVLQKGDVLGIDGKTVSIEKCIDVKKKLSACGIRVRLDFDAAQGIWKNRPKRSATEIRELPLEYAGETAESKIERVRRSMKENENDCLLVTSLEEIAWLLNLRGNDVESTPVFLSYLLLFADRGVLFVQEGCLPDALRKKTENCGLVCRPYDQIEEDLHRLPAGIRLQLDAGSANAMLLDAIPEHLQTVDLPSPIRLMKAVKNQTELSGFRQAHRKDGIALTKFLYWLKSSEHPENESECSASKRLERFRQEQPGYLEPSFSAIVAYGAHGAVVHYEPTEQTDTPLADHGFCLVDSGGHYRDGTTDVTRTVALGELTREEKESYTDVLRGHIALAMAVFPCGICGDQLDVLARMPLWQEGKDYNHGTGHGVGYLLSVHEGPQRISWRGGRNSAVLEKGMVFSNEPGYYAAGKFGVRLENLVTVCEKNDGFLCLETLTLAPFDRSAILPERMTEAELQWLNTYHQTVFEAISPALTAEEAEWLREETKPI